MDECEKSNLTDCVIVKSADGSFLRVRAGRMRVAKPVPFFGSERPEFPPLEPVSDAIRGARGAVGRVPGREGVYGIKKLPLRTACIPAVIPARPDAGAREYVWRTLWLYGSKKVYLQVEKATHPWIASATIPCGLFNRKRFTVLTFPKDRIHYGRSLQKHVQ